MKRKKLPLLLLGALLFPMASSAQHLRENYFEWWPNKNENLGTAIESWQKGTPLSEDDNFFISRIKPKKRFLNANTQVRSDINPENDKRLICWLPVNNPDFRAFQDGVFDSEVFTMWPYVTVWGDWNSPFGRVPATLLDIAHKNGIGVSSEWGIPNQPISRENAEAMKKLAATDPQKAADFMHYYGQNGLGYNSEYNDWYYNVTPAIRGFHVALNKAIAPKDPLFENIWYDGTNDRGIIMFDRGLGNHNQLNFGDADHVASSLFLNYNWNREYLLNQSVNKAKSLKRNPLYLYAGFNMQGGEPKTQNWPLLAKYPISIGLWGAHSRNMFFESRNEKGNDPDMMQRTYLLRTERWFTGGTRNPANTPAVTNSMAYNADNVSFHGMSSFMTAKSSLDWDLSQEPFITYFNLGNGKFFNWQGQRQNNNPWYNLGVQDYLPTWRWWFASELLTKNVPQNGLDAEFVWDDAYVGGSCLRIFGSSANEYLHLFKTKYHLQAGDVITVRYKLMGGHADARLVLTAEGNEKSPINENAMTIFDTQKDEDENVWQTTTFTVGDELAGKDLALMALHFTQADQLNLYLGEMSIVRGQAPVPTTPEVTTAKVFAFNQAGIDGKLIFNMPNNKPAGEPCYNLDVNTGLFKIYAQQENGPEVLMGITNSWAAMVFGAPMQLDNPSNKIRWGVAAVSLDMKSQSPIAWSEYMEAPQYVFSDKFSVDKGIIKPNESFSIGYADPRHEAATWELLKNDKVVATAQGRIGQFEGLSETGVYDLRLTGTFAQHDAQGNFTGSETSTKLYPGYIAITAESVGALPQIESLTANHQTSNLDVNIGDAVNFEYTGRAADGQLSRGLYLKEKGFAFGAKAVGLTSANQAWTMSFWVKFNNIPDGAIQFVDLRDQFTSWPQNNWGCYWSQYDNASKTLTFTMRESNSGGPEHTQNWKVDFVPGLWKNVVIAMEKTAEGVREFIYVDGKLATPISWKKGDKRGEGMIDGYQNTTAWWDNSLMMIGAGRHGCAAMDAIIDDVRFYDNTLNAEQVAELFKTGQFNDHLKAYWSFEKDADTAGNFANEATGGPEVTAARVAPQQGENEGQATMAPITPIYIAGSPFIHGDAYKVATTPTWKASRGVIGQSEGNDRKGKATITYAKDGSYEVTLTLSNDYGQDSKTFKVITVSKTSGIHDAQTQTMRTYTVGRQLFVDFEQAGDYTLEVYDLQGRLMTKATRQVVAGNKVSVTLPAAGAYVLRVTEAGKTVRTAKLICE